MATQEKHRKIIDLSASVFRILSVRASMENTNLKNYIEKMLEDEALTSDENLYEFCKKIILRKSQNPKSRTSLEVGWKDENGIFKAIYQISEAFVGRNEEVVA